MNVMVWEGEVNHHLWEGEVNHHLNLKIDIVEYFKKRHEYYEKLRLKISAYSKLFRTYTHNSILTRINS